MQLGGLGCRIVNLLHFEGATVNTGDGAATGLLAGNIPNQVLSGKAFDLGIIAHGGVHGRFLAIDRLRLVVHVIEPVGLPTPSRLLQRELLGQAIGGDVLGDLELLTLGRRLGELCRVGRVFHGKQAIGDELVTHCTILEADRVVNDHIAGYIGQVLTQHDDTPLNLGAVLGGKPTILVGLAGNLHVSGTDATMRPGQGNVNDLAIHLERQGGLVAVLGGFNGLGLDLHHAVHIVFAFKFLVEGTNNLVIATVYNTVTTLNGTIHQLNAEGALDGNFLGELNGELLASRHAILGTPVPLNTK